MQKRTALTIVIVIAVLIFLGVAIPALDEKVNADFSSQSSSVTIVEDGEVKELDPLVEAFIDSAPKKYISTISRLVKDTLNMYFTEELGVTGDLVLIGDKVTFVANKNQYYSSLNEALPGDIYARVECFIEGAYTFDSSKNLITFADAVQKCRAFAIDERAVSEKEVKESFKTIALINDVELDLILEIVASSTKYEKLKNKCYNKFKSNYEEMFTGAKKVNISHEGKYIVYNDDKTMAFSLLEQQILDIYKQLFEEA